MKQVPTESDVREIHVFHCYKLTSVVHFKKYLRMDSRVPRVSVSYISRKQMRVRKIVAEQLHFFGALFGFLYKFSSNCQSKNK